MFNDISESQEKDGRERRCGPFKGRLANSLTAYPDTLNLKLRILVQPVGTRPLFILEDEHHPLAQAQKHGISRHEASELSATLLGVPDDRLLT